MVSILFAGPLRHRAQTTGQGAPPSRHRARIMRVRWTQARFRAKWRTVLSCSTFFGTKKAACLSRRTPRNPLGQSHKTPTDATCAARRSIGSTPIPKSRKAFFGTSRTQSKIRLRAAGRSYEAKQFFGAHLVLPPLRPAPPSAAGLIRVLRDDTALSIDRAR